MFKELQAFVADLGMKEPEAELVDLVDAGFGGLIL